MTIAMMYARRECLISAAAEARRRRDMRAEEKVLAELRVLTLGILAAEVP